MGNIASKNLIKKKKTMTTDERKDEKRGKRNVRIKGKRQNRLSVCKIFASIFF
jgi:uncharacterized membrane protein